MPTEEPPLGVKLKRVAVHRQHCTLGRHIRLPSHLRCLVLALQSSCRCLAPPFARHRHHRDRRCHPTRMGTATATAIAIGIVAVVIPIRTAATTDAVLPAVNSAAAVREHCHHCRVRAPVGSVVVNDDAIAADAPEASPLSLSGAMDLAEILGDPYSKKSPLPSIGTSPRLATSPKDISYRVLGQSRIHHKHTTRNNHPRILAQ